MTSLDKHSVTKDQSKTVMEEIIQGYKKYQIVLSAIEFGLFTYLHEKGPSNKEEISESLKIKGMLTKAYLQILTEMGLLVEHEKTYSNSNITEEQFFQNNLDGFNWFKYSGAKNPNWNKLKDSLSQVSDDTSLPLPAPSKEYIDYLAQRSLQGEVQAITKAVMDWDGFSRAKSLLDIGEGHGGVSIALCNENKDLTATVVGKPQIEQYIQSYQMQGRIINLGNTVPIEDISGEFDIVLFSHYLYQHRKYLEYPFEKAYQIMKPGGLLIANHWFCEVGCGPGQDGITDLDKAFLSFGHPLCHVNTFQRFFTGQGFTLISEQDIPSVLGQSHLHVAIKKPVNTRLPDKNDSSSHCCCD